MLTTDSVLSITLSGSWILNIFTLFDNVSAEIVFGKASFELFFFFLLRIIDLVCFNLSCTGCPAKLFTLGYLLFCGLLLMQIAKVGTFLKNSGNLLHDRHKNFEN